MVILAPSSAIQSISLSASSLGLRASIYLFPIGSPFAENPTSISLTSLSPIFSIVAVIVTSCPSSNGGGDEVVVDTDNLVVSSWHFIDMFPLGIGILCGSLLQCT